jgi:hypothetical protein
VYVENVTHAPVADGGILYLYQIATGQTLNDIGVIGGGFEPCNQYLVEATVENGKLSDKITVRYKGLEFETNLSSHGVPTSLDALLFENANPELAGNDDALQEGTSA